MEEQQIRFPILIFEKSDSKMFGLDYKYLVGDIRFLDKTTGNYSAFRNVEFIDSNGNVYYVDKVEKASGIKLWYSIKLVGLMIKLEPIFYKPTSNISIEDLRVRIMNHVKKNSKMWLPLDTIEGIENMVNRANSFKEIIRIFR